MEDAEKDILLMEYDKLWDYYCKTLDERRAIFSVYYRVITIPLVLSSAAAVFVKTIPDGKSDDVEFIISGVVGALGIFFLSSYFAGVAAYVYYALESANSRLYLIALQAIRVRWRRDFPRLSKDLIIEYIRPKNKIIGDLIIFTRGSVFILVNSAVGITGGSFFAMFIIYDDATLRDNVSFIIYVSVVLFITSVIIHGVAGYLVARSYAKDRNLIRINKYLIDETDREVGAQYAE